jgi:hypothetical protein
MAKEGNRNNEREKINDKRGKSKIQLDRDNSEYEEGDEVEIELMSEKSGSGTDGEDGHRLLIFSICPFALESCCSAITSPVVVVSFLLAFLEIYFFPFMGSNGQSNPNRSSNMALNDATHVGIGTIPRVECRSSVVQSLIHSVNGKSGLPAKSRPQ